MQYIDNIIIGGRTTSELLERQKQVFARLKTRNLTVNLQKSCFLQDSILYMGHQLSAEGISPETSKIDAINSLKAPTTIKELRSFLGMITYCSKFVPHFATITEPLHRLLKKDSTWEWLPVHQDTFEHLQSMLLSSETLAYFNPTAYTEVITDASPVGLGAIILQRQPNGNLQPISYASHSLTDVEKRYSQIERESLGIHSAIIRFRMYLYGMKFVSLFKPTSRPPP